MKKTISINLFLGLFLISSANLWGNGISFDLLDEVPRVLRTGSLDNFKAKLQKYTKDEVPKIIINPRAGTTFLIKKGPDLDMNLLDYIAKYGNKRKIKYLLDTYSFKVTHETIDKAIESLKLGNIVIILDKVDKEDIVFKNLQLLVRTIFDMKYFKPNVDIVGIAKALVEKNTNILNEKNITSLVNFIKEELKNFKKKKNKSEKGRRISKTVTDNIKNLIKFLQKKQKDMKKIKGKQKSEKRKEKIKKKLEEIKKYYKKKVEELDKYIKDLKKSGEDVFSPSSSKEAIDSFLEGFESPPEVFDDPL